MLITVNQNKWTIGNLLGGLQVRILNTSTCTELHPSITHTFTHVTHACTHMHTHTFNTCTCTYAQATHACTLTQRTHNTCMHTQHMRAHTTHMCTHNTYVHVCTPTHVHTLKRSSFQNLFVSVCMHIFLGGIFMFIRFAKSAVTSKQVKKQGGRALTGGMLRWCGTLGFQSGGHEVLCSHLLSSASLMFSACVQY
jgi:hypothetical protein